MIARNAISLILAIILSVAALVFPLNTWAASGNVQICEPSASCTIGEFLYDDSYAPITAGATCSITSRYPNGTLFLNNVSLTASAEGDGWYAHTFTAPATLGLYRTTINCTVSGQAMGLDKTFEVSDSGGLSQNDVSSAVWGAARSSFTGAGTFGEALQSIVPSATDVTSSVWSYSGRSLTTFGTLVSDIWNNATRTLTGAGLSTGSIATKSDVDAVKSDVSSLKTTVESIDKTTVATTAATVKIIEDVSKETRNLLEQLINKPIIETVTEEVPDLGAKLKETENAVTRLYLNSEYINSTVGLAKLRWNDLDRSEILDITEDINRKLGGENDSASSQSVFGGLSFLSKSWDWDAVSQASSQVKSIRQALLSVQKELQSQGKSKDAGLRFNALVSLSAQLGTTIGNSTGKQSDKTLFGKIKETKIIADSLNRTSGDVESLLAKWNSYRLTDKQKRLNEISKSLISINRIPNVSKNLLLDYSTEKELRNKSYFVLGIVSSNKKLLAVKNGSALSNTWLEVGSIVFKSLVTNPSSIISQKVDLKYYLPPEVKEEHIIETDEGLTVKYDTEKNQYYVSGEFTLAPSETRTLSVRVDDVWVLNSEKIESLRKQASELSKPLENTSYFAQGVTLKSDIDVSLDKALILLEKNTTPEVKIRSYREAQIEIKAAEEKMEKLKELATQAGSAGTFFGFVGGAQTLAVWGLIIILGAGFVFLSLYMRVLIKNEKVVVVSQKGSKPKDNGKEVKEHEEKAKSGHPYFRHVFKIANVFLIFGLGGGLVLGLLLGRGVFAPSQTPQESKVLGSVEEKAPTAACEDLPEESADELQSGVLEEDVLSAISQTVTITDTPTGFLRVRKAPWGEEITQASPGDTFSLLKEDGAWLQIELEKGVSGWIFSEYAIKS